MVAMTFHLRRRHCRSCVGPAADAAAAAVVDDSTRFRRSPLSWSSFSDGQKRRRRRKRAISVLSLPPHHWILRPSRPLLAISRFVSLSSSLSFLLFLFLVLPPPYTLLWDTAAFRLLPVPVLHYQPQHYSSSISRSSSSNSHSLLLYAASLPPSPERGPSTVVPHREASPAQDHDHDDDEDANAHDTFNTSTTKLQQQQQQQQHMELIWCDATSVCMAGEEYLREMVLRRDDNDDDDMDPTNHHHHHVLTSNPIVYRGPATGQVAYHWIPDDPDRDHSTSTTTTTTSSTTSTTLLPSHCILFLIKHGSDMEGLCHVAREAMIQLLSSYRNPIHIVLDKDTLAMIQQQQQQSSMAPPPNDYPEKDDNITTDVTNDVDTKNETRNATTTDPNDQEQLDAWFRERVHLLDPTTTKCRGFGTEHISTLDIAETEFGMIVSSSSLSSSSNNKNGAPIYAPNLIVTLGGDGLLMHAGMLFQGPMPPILCIAGGSLGFLTPFAPNEMIPAIEIALGLTRTDSGGSSSSSSSSDSVPNHDDASGRPVPEAPPSKRKKKKDMMPNPLQIFPPNMAGYDDYDDAGVNDNMNDRYINGIGGYNNKDSFPNKFTFGLGDCICLSIRMRLDCRIIDQNGIVKARYNVLNEVVIDRGSSPYLAALECFCDDVHLTTVQADGVIFATPTGSTAYSLAAGSSVVHPAVPCILVTPICPHVLSFRSMVFPDHVILRCYVPHDARAEASVAFDGKHRQELHRGDSVQIRMSAYPVPTINRQDHSADWLSSLKRNFNFNSRPRQRPL